MTDDDADPSEKDYVPLIDRANVTLSEQESKLVDELVDGDEYGTSISADEMAIALVEADIDDEHREATVDDLVYAYRNRIDDTE
ncbi:hypothetical protein [Halococcus sp. IIIV-5B]|uniref:hypothetical protein n=1 Tax=Halococcus sp. IIIV-5B TaxID=2321230 RepID=UPI000E73F364|nr:hypothetical protein [Halococcus sp. IIIV-5B]RJT03862.1 hypothetical protein D3261_10480 [Halococcus sp. IIIV-5B]